MLVQPPAQVRLDVWIYNQIQDLWRFASSLYVETRRGPWRLGPIDTTKYDRQFLEEPLLELLNEAFQFESDQRWLFTQILFFTKPVLHAIGSPIINRIVMKGIYFLICEEQIVNYLLLFRLSFWPDNNPAPANYAVRSEREKKETKKDLEDALVNLIAPLCSPLLGQQLAEERTRFLVDVFQYKSINKHLIFVVIDLILAHVASDVAEMRAAAE
nr:sorting nexin 25 [Polyrhizophydium stewartii]